MPCHRLYLVFELVDTDLKKFMDSNKAPLHPDLVQSYTCQIFEGIVYNLCIHPFDLTKEIRYTSNLAMFMHNQTLFSLSSYPSLPHSYS